MEQETEQGTEVAVESPAEYSLKVMALQQIGAVSAGIAVLTEAYAGKVYDISTTLGMATAKAARADIREKRYQIPKIVKAKKQELKKIGDDIQAEGDRIETILMGLESPIHKQIKDEEDRKETERAAKAEAERVRIATIMGAIEHVKAVAAAAARMTVDEIDMLYSKVELLPIGEAEYMEFRPMAQEAKVHALQDLTDLRNEKVALEAEALRITEEKALEDARIKAEQDERDRLAEIESDRLAEESKKLQAERDAFEKQKADAAAIKEEEDRQQAAKDAIAIEEKAVAQAEIDRQAAAIKQLKDEAAEVFWKQERAEAEAIRKQEEAASETVTILKSEYIRLLILEIWVEALNSSGLDNWDGIDAAIELYQSNLQEMS